MGKLVRNKIPQIIREDGNQPKIRTLSDSEYLIELDNKLNEEIAEYQADKSLEELVDVMEVIYAICDARGYSINDLMRLKEKKRVSRGGFEEKIYWEGNI